MDGVAVVAKVGKSLGDGLPALRDLLRSEGVRSPMWYEVSKGKHARKCAREAVTRGARLIFVWGGDGTVQRCIDATAGTGTALALMPAGTANLLARYLEIPDDLEAAARIGLHGDRRRIDTATINGEHFAVMAGAGMDALLIRDADAGLKDRFGRLAYLWTGARNLDASPVKATVELEGRPFFKGEITCVMFGNTSDIGGGIELFDGSRTDDGLLEFGVVEARTRLQWIRTFGRAALGRTENSPFVTTGRGTDIRIRFDHPVPYELDGGDRTPTRMLRVTVRPGSATLCVPMRPDGESRQKAAPQAVGAG